MSRRLGLVCSLSLLLSFLTLAVPTARADTTCAATPIPIAMETVATPVSAFPLTVTDDAGRAVSILEEPARIVSLAPSNTEILFALGVEARVVAVDAYSDYPPAAAEKPTIGDYADPDLEQIVALDPDLVLATAVHETTIVPRLEALGIPAAVIEPADLAATLDSITTIGMLTGRDDAATELVCALHARIDAVAAAVAGAARPRVFFELSPDLYTAGHGTFVDDLIARAGGENVVGAGLGPWPQLSAEAVIAADPEVILLADHEAGVTPDSVAARPGWSVVSAVRDERIVPLDTDLVVRPGPRVVDGLEAIARALHPGRFP
jgi:iron complex transport system substrate-binding protein